jgi:hypothetical protein
MSQRRIQALLWSVIAVSLLAVAGPTSGQEPLSAFMKAKLEHSQKTLEGLAKADFELIVTHSQAISLLCEDELLAVLKTPEYSERSKEFQRSVNAITDAG